MTWEMVTMALGDAGRVGDDLRDIQAARAASMPVLAATYGYLGDGETPDQWGADGLIASPLEVLNYLP